MRVFQKRGVANALPLFLFFFSEGANVHLYTFLEGGEQMSTPLYELGGQMSSHAVFRQGQIPDGANVRLPRPGLDFKSHQRGVAAFLNHGGFLTNKRKCSPSRV